MTALRADWYSQAVRLSTRSSAPDAMLRTRTSCVMSAASSGSRTRAETKARRRSRVSPQSVSPPSTVLSLRAFLMGILRGLHDSDEAVPEWTQQDTAGSPGTGVRVRPPRPSFVYWVDSRIGREQILEESPMTTSRIQLALNVND